MAAIYVTEYARLGSGDYASVETQSPVEPYIDTHKFTISGTAAATPKLDEATRIIKVSTDNIAHVKLTPFEGGADVTDEDTRLPADTITFYSVAKGSELKLSAITGA